MTAEVRKHLVAADQAVGAVAVGGDAVEGEPGPPCASQDPPGHVLRRGWAGGCRAPWPGLALRGPSGHRPCWDPFWLCRPSPPPKADDKRHTGP